MINFMYVQFNINIIDRVGLPFMWSWFVKLQQTFVQWKVFNSVAACAMKSL